MPDWKAFVQERLRVPELKGLRRERLVEELAAQLEDIERAALGRGLDAESSTARAAGHIADWEDFSQRLAAEERMNRLPDTARWIEETERQLDLRGGPAAMLAELTRTVRHTLRSVHFEPWFWGVTVGILALGIGATTTIFSVVNGVLLRSLPYADPGEIISVQEPSFSMPRFQDYAENLTSYEILTSRWETEIDWTGGDQPLQLDGSLITPGYLELFGAAPEIGRLFGDDDYRGAPHRAIISHGAWVRLFGADPGVIGRTLILDGRITEVIGVTAAGFTSPDGLAGREQDIWLAMDPEWDQVQTPRIWMLDIYGRLRDGVSLVAAQREMDEALPQLAEIHPDLHINRNGDLMTVQVVPFQDVLVGEVRGTLVLLLGSVSLLLLIACANVANLFLARGTTRFHEVAVRSAMGAGRGRIIMQLLIESAVFALAGGLLGCALALAGVRAFAALNPGNIPLLEQVTIDLPVLGFAIGLSLLTGLFFGVIPALRAARLNVADLLREGVRGAEGPDRGRLRSTLVVAEIALALILLAGAGLLFNSLLRLHAVEPGFDAARLAAVELRMEPERYDENSRRQFVERLIARIESLPGVERAAVSMTVPFQYFGEGRSGWWSGAVADDTGRQVVEFVLTQPVSEGYFEALGAHLVGGGFTRENRDADSVPTVLTGGLAEAVFPGGDAVGRIYRGLGEARGEALVDLQLVGVVTGLHHWGLDQGEEPTLYVPWQRFGAQMPMTSLLVRTRGDPSALLPLLRETIWDLDPDMALPNVFTLTDRIRESLVTPRFYSALLLTFAAVALLLAAAGIYGSMLYRVERRRREMGIRTALGADRSRLICTVMMGSVRITALGLLLGISGAIFLTRLLRGMVFGVSTFDPVTFAVVAVIMGAVAIVASLLPARRAASTDPVEALRAE